MVEYKIGLTWKRLIICYYFPKLFLLVTKHFKYSSHFWNGLVLFEGEQKANLENHTSPMILQILQLKDCGARACGWRPLRGIKFFLSFICKPIYILVNVLQYTGRIFLSLVETFVYLTHNFPDVCQILLVQPCPIKIIKKI